ncbi:uncharacterized protein LOC129774646 [Toxorhynchites rutilus septentrionalis]|uniref:uncharacterized protein LOC129774646 n=1 Tax=Toxorhynchites rutilus septentrionalis TaxID=329112 RepID=UPI00247A620A|nr:uncharacterized protein LOC129774646 [Toxorhynchites rutilus septentrionalis]
MPGSASGRRANKTGMIWNHHLASKACKRLEDNFRFVYDTNINYSYLQTNESIAGNDEIDKPREIEGCESNPKDSFYNIIQNKMNLNDKRGPKFLCNKCRYAMHTRLSMITHMKFHLKPFCEVCFAVFESRNDVDRHIGSEHPEVINSDCLSVVPNRSYYNVQTAAPPNTPNPTSDDEHKMIDVLVNPITKYTTDVNNVAKQNDTGTGVIDNMRRLVINDDPRSVPTRGRPSKKQFGLKRQLKKKLPKCRTDTGKPENAMRKITSRFGRAISLKIPQY